MDRKVRERRRLVGRERGYRRASLIFLCALALVATALFLWLRSADVFAVTEVTGPVTQHVTSAEIADAVAPARGVSLLKVSTRAIEQKLSKLPYVRTVHVYRHFPNGLDVRVEEYEPVARVQQESGQEWLIAENGRVLERSQTSADTALPVLVPAGRVSLQPGDTVPHAVLAAIPVVIMLRAPQETVELPGIDRIVVAVGGEIVVCLVGGTELRLGAPTDLKQKMMVAAGIVQEHLRDGKTLEYVDTSVVDRVAVKVERK
jgi:POTRA domain, FtsQ-type/Cell division protein FtsQ/DivIB, C-terminal